MCSIKKDSCAAVNMGKTFGIVLLITLATGYGGKTVYDAGKKLAE